MSGAETASCRKFKCIQYGTNAMLRLFLKKLSFGTEFCFVQIAFHFNDAKFLRDAATGLNLESVYEAFCICTYYS